MEVYFIEKVEYIDVKKLIGNLQSIKCRLDIDFRNEKIDWTEFSKIRDFTIIMLGINCGLKSNEILNLKISDLIIDSNAILIKCNNEKKRTVFFGNNFKKTLIYYLEARKQFNNRSYWSNKSNYLFFSRTSPSLSKNALFNLVAKYTGTGPTALRDTFAVNFYNQTHDLKLLQKVLGHKKIENVEKYILNLPTVTDEKKGANLMDSFYNLSGIPKIEDE